ncbi:MAG: ATP-binding protein involved in chromosome partitioning [Actinomycetota bacterium]|nr:ATP-binding protein involved in chromosome partitioning [Actinomycetota bacterium]
MPMPSSEQISAVLGEIQDPELHRGLNELNMVRKIDIKGSEVTVLIALTIPGCPLKDYFHSVIPAKLKETYSDITNVTVELTSMTDEERQSLIGGLRKDAPAPFARSDSPTQVIAVGSGKGGVGKSTTTVNLAASLSKLGHTVGLLDADVWGFSIPRMLGIHERPTVVDDMIMPPEVFGIKVVSIGLFTTEDNPVVWRGPMLHKALQQFLSDVHWDEPDYLLVDLPPGTGDVSISIAQFLPGAAMVVVTTPQAVSEKVAQRAGFMAEKTGLKVTGVVENMSWFTGDDGKQYRLFGEGGGQVLADKLHVPLLGQIPMDPQLREFADAGAPIVLQNPDSDVAQALDQTAKELVNLLPPRPKPSKRISLPLVGGSMGGGHQHSHEHSHSH